MGVSSRYHASRLHRRSLSVQAGKLRKSATRNKASSHTGCRRLAYLCEQYSNSRYPFLSSELDHGLPLDLFVIFN